MLILNTAHGAQPVHIRGADPAVFFTIEGERAPVWSRAEAHTTEEVKERVPLPGGRGGQATDQQAVEAGVDHLLHRGGGGDAVGVELRHGRSQGTDGKPGVHPEGGAGAVSDSHSGDVPIKREEPKEGAPVRATERTTPFDGVKRRAIEARPDPARPRFPDGGVEAVEQLHQQAFVLIGERADAQATLGLGTIDEVPRHQALGARHLVGARPEEGTT
jgi:hypothetical protein